MIIKLKSLINILQITNENKHYKDDFLLNDTTPINRMHFPLPENGAGKMH